VPTAKREEAKKRRNEDTKLLYASVATRFARQRVRESQIQAALDHELFVSAILGLAGGRPKGRRRRTPVSLPGWRTGRQPSFLMPSSSASSLRLFAETPSAR